MSLVPARAEKKRLKNGALPCMLAAASRDLFGGRAVVKP
jgi:hypothetical protein